MPEPEKQLSIFDESRDLLAELLQKADEQKQAGQLIQAREKYQRALDLARELLQKYGHEATGLPGLIERAKAGLGAEPREELLKQGHRALEDNNPGEAAGVFREILNSVSASDQEAALGLAEALYRLGRQAEQNSMPIAATGYYQEALDTYPQHSEARSRLTELQPNEVQSPSGSARIRPVIVIIGGMLAVAAVILLVTSRVPTPTSRVSIEPTPVMIPSEFTPTSTPRSDTSGQTTRAALPTLAPTVANPTSTTLTQTATISPTFSVTLIADSTPTPTTSVVSTTSSPTATTIAYTPAPTQELHEFQGQIVEYPERRPLADVAYIYLYGASEPTGLGEKVLAGSTASSIGTFRLRTFETYPYYIVWLEMDSPFASKYQYYYSGGGTEGEAETKQSVRFQNRGGGEYGPSIFVVIANTPAPTDTPNPPATATTTPPPPTASPTYPAPILVSPDDGFTAYAKTTFAWNWTGPALTAGQAFELRLWKDGQEQHYGAAQPTKATRLTIEVTGTFAAQTGGNGRYLWTVAVVEQDPYERIAPEAPPRGLVIR